MYRQASGLAAAPTGQRLDCSAWGAAAGTATWFACQRALDRPDWRSGPPADASKIDVGPRAARAASDPQEPEAGIDRGPKRRRGLGPRRPSPQYAGTPVTNIRNTASPHWRRWLSVRAWSWRPRSEDDAGGCAQSSQHADSTAARSPASGARRPRNRRTCNWVLVAGREAHDRAAGSAFST
jgi:hypothetical protein